MNEIDRQLEQFAEQQDWLFEEVQFAAAMPPGMARERRLQELSGRCQHLDRELKRFVERGWLRMRGPGSGTGPAD